MTSPTTDRRQGLVGNTPYKAPVTVVSIVNVQQSGEQAIDGVALRAVNAAGSPDRVLCTAQSDPTKNGIWDVSTAAWTRSADANGNFDLARGTQVLVNQGTIGAQQIWFLSTPNPILIGATALSWTLLTVAAAAYPGQPTVIVGDGVTDRSAAIQAANALGRPMLFFGVAVVGTPTTITVPIVDTMSQIFSTASQVTIANGLPVRPEWFGLATAGAADRAVAALPATGGVIRFEDKTYLRPFVHAFDSAYLSKNNVILDGAKTPRYADDCQSLTGGTILQGNVLAYADGFEARNLGVDSGKTFCDANNGGVAMDGLTLTYGTTALKNAAALRKAARLHNVIALAYGPASLFHAMIAGEGYSNVECSGTISGCYGVHGIAIKCASFRADKLVAYCNNQDGVTIKTDIQATAVASDVQIGEILIKAAGPDGAAPYAVGTAGIGLNMLAGGGTIDKVQIGRVMSYGYPVCVGTSFTAAYIISDISIDSIITDQQGVAGTKIGVQILAAAGEIKRFRIGSITARNTTVGLQAAFTQGAGVADHLHVDRLEVVNGANALDIGNSSYVHIGHVATDNLSAGVYHITGTPRLTVGALSKDSLTTIVYDPTNAGLAPVLSNGWTQVAANDPFGVDLNGGRIFLRGLIKPGASSSPMTLPQFLWPSSNKRFLAQGYNGATQVAVPVNISTAGVVTVNEVAGGFANCTTWLSLSGANYDQQA